MVVNIGIITFENDIHALAIDNYLTDNYDVNCHVIEFDKVSGCNAIHWGMKKGNIPTASIKTRSGYLDPSALDLIWWRRTAQQQINVANYDDESQISVINNDSRETLVGTLLSCFTGKWISHPYATNAASNKLVQLKAAANCGLRIPETIISQDIKEIQEFYNKLNGNVIIKPVKGTHKTILYSRKLKEDDFQSEISITACPAIYQECISGNTHIRVNCFGSDIYSAEIVSDELDWRGDLNVPFKEKHLDQDTKMKVLNTLRLLNLEMGIVDLKIDDSGEIVWFEVNPQGQFLFVEGLTKMRLTKDFCDFLHDEAINAASTRKLYQNATNS